MNHGSGAPVPQSAPAKSVVNLENLSMRVEKRDGTSVSFDRIKVEESIRRCSKGFENEIVEQDVIEELIKNSFDGISTKDLEKALILAAVALIERDPAYNKLAARLTLQKIYKEISGKNFTDDTLITVYKESFINGIKEGIAKERFDAELADYPLEELAEELCIERDDLFGYMGIQTLYERYFVKHKKKRLELPQSFWMRVAMGLALGEKKELRKQKTLEFYHTLSTLRYVSSTPTLFHAGLVRSQLSSCYLTYIDDDLNHIFKCLGDNANLSKYSGGIGSDWTPLRGTGSPIETIGVDSQGVIPFLKIANDVVAAINRSGSRRGAAAVYLESWHLDFEDFIDLRRNTGDERRRTHDMNTAAWIPDLFMKRVLEDKEWTFFSPHETPDLHELYGKKFEDAYHAYEEKTKTGEIKFFKRVKAKDLWRKMLSRLFETGHPWITFKDACNVRSPQDHVGVVHSSNLCTEITLNTSREETAVCNLGSVNLSKHIVDGKLDKQGLEKTIKTAIRMLDNVIDINFYPTVEAKNSNLRHRPIGLGVMGLQDALFKADIPFADKRALDFIDELMEHVSYYAIMASSELAKEHGAYPSYKGSKWDRGIFPIDTLDVLEQEREMPIEVSRQSKLDWTSVREHVKKHGIRNSNMMAIAPTATISNISGCFPCIEPIYKNMYVKANMSGEFTVVNEYLVEDLKKLGLWNQDMIDLIKYYDGSVQMIDVIPEDIREKYKESFEIDPEWLVQLTAARAKWIDQSQSHNVFMKGVSGKKLSDIYISGWKAGMKTFYYLRTMAASQIEKATLDPKKFGFTQKRNYDKVAQAQQGSQNATEVKSGLTCNPMEKDTCDSCQ